MTYADSLSGRNLILPDTLDEDDRKWVDSFIGKSIPADSIVEGFISIICWIDGNGDRQWRHYIAMDSPLSNMLGLMTMAQHQMMIDNTINTEGEEE